MKKILAILILIFTLQTPSWADDVRDFQIEGMSIGESLLDYFDKEQIEKEKKSEFVYFYKNNKFMDVGMGGNKSYSLFKKLEIYDELGAIIKPNDKTYKIYAISGQIFCRDDFNICLSKKKEIVSVLKDFFGNKAKLHVWNKKHRADKTGNSMVYATDFSFKSSKDEISVAAYEWSKKLQKEKRWHSNLKVEISSEEFINFLQSPDPYSY